MRALTPTEFLDEIRRRGAVQLRRVSFRRNRSTIWSLTQRGAALNVHVAYRRSSPELLDAFAVIASEGGVSTAEARAAGRRVREWPELQRAVEEARSEHESRQRAPACAEGGTAHCCATADQLRYFRAIYRYLNHTRFNGVLPADVPVRLSSRMKSALGHMLPGGGEGVRYVVEIALNVDLMLEGNGVERVDTLLHEMAHAADYLVNGNSDHGQTWREWASRVGCMPETLYDRPVHRRVRHHDTVDRVPPLPLALQRRSD
jgi:hypothetical protein